MQLLYYNGLHCLTCSITAGLVLKAQTHIPGRGQLHYCTVYLIWLVFFMVIISNLVPIVISIFQNYETDAFYFEHVTFCKKVRKPVKSCCTLYIIAGTQIVRNLIVNTNMWFTVTNNFLYIFVSISLCIAYICLYVFLWFTMKIHTSVPQKYIFMKLRTLVFLSIRYIMLKFQKDIIFRFKMVTVKLQFWRNFLKNSE